MHVRRSALSVLLVAPVLLASAGRATAQQRRGAAPPNANQLALNRAADALLALRSTRFSIKREGVPASLDEKSGITFTAADCVYAAPDRVSCDVKVSLKSGTILQLTRVWVPEGTFQSNPLTKQWAMVPADANFNGALLFAKTGIADVLRTSVQKPHVVGKEQLQNIDTLHLAGEVSGEKLAPLVGGTIKPELTYPVDLWIDATTSNARQLHIKEPDGNGWLIELSGTNEPAEIPTPRLAPPTPGRL